MKIHIYLIHVFVLCWKIIYQKLRKSKDVAEQAELLKDFAFNWSSLIFQSN